MISDGTHEPLRLGDGDVLNLRVQPLDPDAEVLLERQLDRLVDRQPPRRRRGHLSGLTENGHRRGQDSRQGNRRERRMNLRIALRSIER